MNCLDCHKPLHPTDTPTCDVYLMNEIDLPQLRCGTCTTVRLAASLLDGHSMMTGLPAFYGDEVQRDDDA